jgi:GT2 family glycosyltransferase
MRVGAVVLHYRLWPQVRSTLEGLASQTRPPDDLVVVDNRSGDGSLGELRAAFPEIEIVETAANLGYAGGMNVGTRMLMQRGVEAVLLLTHECRLAPDALEEMVDRLEREPGLGAVGPLIGYRTRPDTVFSAGGVMDRRWRPQLVREPALMATWASAPPHAAEWLHGSCLLLRGSAIRQAGEMDERYFLYFEETEYLLTIGRLGWRVECVPAAVAWQEPGIQPTYLWVRNRLRFQARTGRPRHVVREAGRLAASIVRDSVFPNRRATPVQLQARRRALFDFLARRWGPDTYGPTREDGEASPPARGTPSKPGRGDGAGDRKETVSGDARS